MILRNKIESLAFIANNRRREAYIFWSSGRPAVREHLFLVTHYLCTWWRDFNETWPKWSSCELSGYCCKGFQGQRSRSRSMHFCDGDFISTVWRWGYNFGRRRTG